MRIRPHFFVSMLAAVVLVVSACGGEDDPVGATNGTVTVETGEATEELERRADEVQRIVEERVRDLSDVRSLDDLSAQLESARTELEQAAEDVGDTDVAAELEEERDDLERAARDLAGELEGVQAEVDADDLTGALREARELDAVREVEDAIARIREQTDG